jgi:long-subunit acyl-CoA synthetase (AMP-forming)
MYLLIEAILTIPFQLILDRIAKGVHDKVSKGSELTRALFNFAYKYKCAWTKKGFDTPLMNRYILLLSPVLESFFFPGMCKLSEH